MRLVKPKKFLGQHFLKDLKVAQDIADTVDTFPELPILEVGPGMGVLTQFLVKKDRLIKVVEVDYHADNSTFHFGRRIKHVFTHCE